MTQIKIIIDIENIVLLSQLKPAPGFDFEPGLNFIHLQPDTLKVL